MVRWCVRQEEHDGGMAGMGSVLGVVVSEVCVVRVMGVV